MSFQGTSEVASTPTGHVSVTRKSNSEPMSDLVRDCLDLYFEQLDGTQPTDLHQLVISQVELPLFERVMQYTGGNQTKAAQVLGISRATLRKKLALYNID